MDMLSTGGADPASTILKGHDELNCGRNTSAAADDKNCIRDTNYYQT